MLYPVQNLTHVITPVLHPILSYYQNDKDYVYKKYMKVVKVLSILGLFFTIFCFWAGDEIVLIMFGNQWINSIGCFKILSICIWLQVITSSTSSIFQALGETKLLYKTGLITTFVNIAGIVIGILDNNIRTVSIMISMAYYVNFIIAYVILITKVFNRLYLEFIKSFKGDVIILSIMVVGIIIFKFTIETVLLSLILKCVLSLITFAIGIAIIKQKEKIKFVNTKFSIIRNRDK